MAKLKQLKKLSVQEMCTLVRTDVRKFLKSVGPFTYEYVDVDVIYEVLDYWWSNLDPDHLAYIIMQDLIARGDPYNYLSEPEQAFVQAVLEEYKKEMAEAA